MFAVPTVISPPGGSYRCTFCMDLSGTRYRRPRASHALPEHARRRPFAHRTHTLHPRCAHARTCMKLSAAARTSPSTLGCTSVCPAWLVVPSAMLPRPCSLTDTPVRDCCDKRPRAPL